MTETVFNFISLILSVITTLVVLVGTYVAIKNLEKLVMAHKDNHEWNRRIATQDALTKLREINIDDLNKEFGYANQLTSIPLETVLAKFEANPSLQLSCHKLLNFYEGLASGVNLGIFDEITLKTNRRGAMERDFAKFRNYIMHRRDQVSKTLFIEQEKITTRWHEELLSKSSREVTGDI